MKLLHFILYMLYVMAYYAFGEMVNLNSPAFLKLMSDAVMTGNEKLFDVVEKRRCEGYTSASKKCDEQIAVLRKLIDLLNITVVSQSIAIKELKDDAKRKEGDNRP